MKFFAAAATLALVRAQDWNPCDCLGYDALPTYLFEESGFTDEYGSYCNAWDAGQNPDCFEGAEYEDADWCADDFDWCYVDETCETGQHTIYYLDAKLYWRDCSLDDWVGEYDWSMIEYVTGVELSDEDFENLDNMVSDLADMTQFASRATYSAIAAGLALVISQ